MASATQSLQAPAASYRRREVRRAWRSMIEAKWPLLAVFILFCVLFAAVFGPNVAPLDPNRQNIMLRLASPLTEGRGNTLFLLGTDGLGRDVFSRLLYGARVSLLVGISAILVGGTIGVVAGLVSGYFGGWIDDIIMRLGDIQLAFPFILFAIMFLVILGPGLANIILVLGVGQWVTYARIVGRRHCHCARRNMWRRRGRSETARFPSSSARSCPISWRR